MSAPPLALLSIALLGGGADNKHSLHRSLLIWPHSAAPRAWRAHAKTVVLFLIKFESPMPAEDGMHLQQESRLDLAKKVEGGRKLFYFFQEMGISSAGSAEIGR